MSDIAGSVQRLKRERTHIAEVEVGCMIEMEESRYKKYLLSVLVAVLACNYVDRLALGLVLQDIKVELALSDMQLGLLSGIAFSLFYSLMGIPIARWADRGNRVAIISLTTALWSAAVALCGAAGNFVHLILIRIGVAVGEAGCLPPAHSLIADHFTRAERPRATAIYSMGVPLSSVIGYFVAGWLNELYGWRAMFVILGLPGVGLAALVWFTLKEPRLAKAPLKFRSDSGQAAEAAHDAPSLSEPPSLWHVCRVLWANTSFRHLLFCFSIVSFFGYGVAQWKPAFFVRSFGLQTGELGTWLAVIYGLGGLLGLIWGGELATRFAPNNERLQLRAAAVGYAAFGVVSALVYFAPNHYSALGLLAIATVGGALTVGPVFATIQTLVPQEMRATAIAFIYLFANLVGMGLGPLAVGALSDALRLGYGEESLRYALLAMCPGYIWGGLHIWWASKTVTRDLKAVHGFESPATEVRLETGARTAKT